MRRARALEPMLVLGLLLSLGLALARLGAKHPLLMVAAPLPLAALVLVAAARRWPMQALHVSVFAVLVAGTKFRSRDASDSMSGDADAQVLLELALFAAAALVIVAIWIFRRPLLDRRRMVIPELLLAGFTTLAFASALWSTSAIFTVIRAWEFGVLLALVMLIGRMTDAPGLLRVLTLPAVVYAVTCSLMAKVLPFAKGLQVDFYGIHRFSWFAVHPIDAATYAALAALFVLGALLYSERPFGLRWSGVPVWLLLPYLLVVIAATRSRGPLVAWLAAAGLLLVLRRGTALNTTIALAIVLVGGTLARSGGVTFASVLNAEQGSRNPIAQLFLRGQSADEFTSLTDRDEVWTVCYDLIRRRPFVGVGFQDSRSYLLQIIPWAAYAHNAFIQTLVDLGVLGAILLYGAFATAFVPGSPRARDATLDLRGARAMVIAAGLFLAVNGISSESFSAAPTYFTLILLGVIVVASRARAARPPAPVARPARARRLPAPRPVLAIGPILRSTT